MPGFCIRHSPMEGGEIPIPSTRKSNNQFPWQPCPDIHRQGADGKSAGSESRGTGRKAKSARTQKLVIMKLLTITGRDLSEGLHAVGIAAVGHANNQYTVSVGVEEGGRHYTKELVYEEPVEADSPLLRLIAAAENKTITREELNGFDMETLPKKRIVIGVVNKRTAGGKLTPTVALVLSVAEVKEFAASLNPTKAAVQPSTTE